MMIFSIETVNEIYKSKNSIVTMVSISLLLVFASYFVDKHFTKKEYITILIVLSFCLRFMWIMIFPTQPVSDFQIMYDSALQASKGIFEFANSNYYTSWVYQLGFTMYEAAIIKIFGESIFILKLLNILYSTATCILIYLITLKIFNEKSARIAGLVYAFNIPNIFFISVLTNQYLSTLLFLLAFYLLLSKWKNLKSIGIWIGVLLSIGNIIRPLGAVLLIAVVLYMFLNRFIGKSSEEKKSSIRITAIVIATYYMVFFLISALFIAGGVTEYQLGNRDPQWKFVVGLNVETNGGYSQSDADLVQKYPVGAERKQFEMSLIKERVEDKEQLLKLFFNKFSIMWGDLDNSSFWSLGELNRDDVNAPLQEYDRYMFIITTIFVLIALLNLIIKQDYSNYTIFSLFIIGYVLIHLGIEIQLRYRFEIIPSLTIFQGFGIALVSSWVTDLSENYFQRIRSYVKSS